MGIMRKTGPGGTIKDSTGRDNSSLDVEKPKAAPYKGPADGIPSGGKMANGDTGYVATAMSRMEGGTYKS
jgi:hypothetical protein